MLGFDPQLLGSEHYLNEKLASFSQAQIQQLKEVFNANRHPRFKRELAASSHQPFGKTSDYLVSVQNANSFKVSRLLKFVGVLSQTKFYLFWSRAQLALTH